MKYEAELKNNKKIPPITISDNDFKSSYLLDIK